MNICSNCQAELSSYKLKCPRCGGRNVNYNSYKAFIVIFLFVGTICGIMNQITFPGMVSNGVLIAGILIIIVLVLFIIGAGKDEDIQKVTIRLQGERLLEDHGIFTIEDISIASGWKMDDTPASEIFKQRLLKVAAEEHWTVNNDVFSKQVKEKDETSK